MRTEWRLSRRYLLVARTDVKPWERRAVVSPDRARSVLARETQDMLMRGTGFLGLDRLVRGREHALAGGGAARAWVSTAMGWVDGGRLALIDRELQERSEQRSGPSAPEKTPEPRTAGEKPLDEDITWLELKLVDLSGVPVKQAAYEVHLIDGRVVKGRLDEQGMARLTSIPKEVARVAFPEFDAAEWGPA